jgi:ABC-type multidrug transport system ATPase subunit
MMALLATLLRPSGGRIRYGAHEAHTHGAALRGAIGVLGHDLFLYPELTARENLAFFAALYGEANAEAAARGALDRAGLADRGDDPVSSFSRGMRQRVALERALIHSPRLVLLDEPFTGLDDASTAALVARLNGLRAAGAIVVLATHDLDLADGLLDCAVFLRDGRMIESMERPNALRETYRRIIGGNVGADLGRPAR